MKSLYDELKKYEQSDFYGFHMPGHKRNGGLTGAALPYGIDITEIDGFDDLHHAKGILKECRNVRQICIMRKRRAGSSTEALSVY